jgi:hypothetical protein
LLVKRLGYAVDHSHPFSVEGRKEWSYTFTPPNAFVACKGTALPFCFNVTKQTHSPVH